MNDQILKLGEINRKKLEDEAKLRQHNEQLVTSYQLQETIVKSFQALTNYLDGRVSKTAVVNQLREISTPDIEKVVDAVNELNKTVTGLDSSEQTQKSLAELTTVMRLVHDEVQKVPKTLAKPAEQKFVDYTKQIDGLLAAVKAMDAAIQGIDLTVEAPIVNIPETQISVEAPNLDGIENGLDAVVSAVKDITIPEVVIDHSELVKLLKKQNKTLEEILDKPVGGRGGGGRATPYQNSEGTPAFVEVNDQGQIPVVTSQDFGVNDIDDSTSTEYYGFTKPNGTYQIRKVTSSGVSYATVLNNSGVTDYSTAWTNKATLTYGRFDQAF